MHNASVMPMEMVRSLLRNRALAGALIRREVAGRYQGSMIGGVWAFFNPVFMLAIYTFVFSVVFKARWNVGSDSKTEFALVLFAGLMVFNLFAECVVRAPSIVVTNPNYVKRVVFPLEILSYVTLGAALFHWAMSFLVWLVFYVIFFGIPPLTSLLLPFVMLPLLMLALGVSWFLSSLGAYLRDMIQITSLATSTLMFISPVFFPVSALPEEYRPVLYLNPLTHSIEQVRDVLFWGKIPDLESLAMSYLIGFAVAWLGFAWFQKTREGFADVV